MARRTLTVTVRRPDGALVPNAVVAVRAIHPITKAPRYDGASDGSIVGGVRLVTNAGGQAIFSLWPQADLRLGSWYRAILSLPEGGVETADFSMPDANTSLAAAVAATTGAEICRPTPGSGGGASTFLDLTDTPTSYAGLGGRYLRVRSSETGLDAQALANVARTGAYADLTGRPLAIARFAAQDADTADDVQGGEIGLFTADGTQIQASDITAARIIDLPSRAAVFGQDAADGSTILTAYDVSRFNQRILYNQGANVLVALTRHGTTSTVWFEADLAVAKTGGMRLSNITHLKGSDTAPSERVGWNVVVAHTHGVAVHNIVDLDKLLLRTAVEGHETDEYSSYNNAPFGAGYWPGTWCLFSGSEQPTDDTNAIRQPDIATGSGILVWGDLRGDPDPNASYTPEALDASEWPNGRVIHASPWHPYDAEGHLRITLTGAAEKVGSGNGERLWAPASWVLVGNANAVQVVGDYFRWSEIQPSGLDALFPPEVISPQPWVRTDGSNVTDEVVSAVQGDNETVTLPDDFRIDATNVAKYISFSTPGGAQLNVGTVRIPSTLAGSQTDTDLGRLLKTAAWCQVDDYVVGVTGNATRALIGTSLTYTFNFDVLEGTKPTGSALRKLKVVGRDTHRGELAGAAFRLETPSIAGRGGAAGQIWAWVSGVADATWRSIVAVLLDAIAPSRTDADRGKVLALKSDDKDAIDLVDSSWRGTWTSGTTYRVGDRVENADELYTCKTANSDTTFTASKWWHTTDAAQYGYYDSTAQSVSGNVSVNDTDSIPIADVNEDGVIATEDISGFGKVYKTAALKSLALTATFNATQGVAWRLRYSDTKPAASDDAKSFGTQVQQFDSNTTVSRTFFDTPANRYWFYTLSGGGSRTVSRRDTRVRATYTL